MTFSGPWFLGEISDKVDFGLAPLPAMPGLGTAARYLPAARHVGMGIAARKHDDGRSFVGVRRHLVTARGLRGVHGETVWPHLAGIYFDAVIRIWGEVGKAEDVARMVVALASDEISGHVTGEVVTVAGGMEGRVLHE